MIVVREEQASFVCVISVESLFFVNNGLHKGYIMPILHKKRLGQSLIQALILFGIIVLFELQRCCSEATAEEADKHRGVCKAR